MKIGSLELGMGLVMAPMAGVTGSPFRRITRRLGADLVCTEMISAAALSRNPKVCEPYMPHPLDPRPISAQLFGAEPEEMEKAAALLTERDPDLIDINMGCPVKKVVRSGSGAALLRNLDHAARIVRSVVRATPLPVTVKFRSGWDHESLCAAEVARMAEGEGAAAVILHPRTKTQGFGGRSEWEEIRKVKETVKIPVIGNGDIRTPGDAADMLRRTGCDGMMIGRAALGDPWIFERIRTYLLTGEIPSRPSPREIYSVLRDQLICEVELSGKTRAVFRMRKFASWYSRGLPASTAFRDRINHVLTCEDFLCEMESFFLQKGPSPKAAGLAYEIGT
ncbi:MAG: tRNA dihydrouridine synthase DusB [Deltaproteobacteria bacterium]|nr:tRNA dihydrouridine synthase DusB [Deltaproteobacteria bacterium]